MLLLLLVLLLPQCDVDNDDEEVEGGTMTRSRSLSTMSTTFISPSRQLVRRATMCDDDEDNDPDYNSAKNSTSFNMLSPMQPTNAFWESVLPTWGSVRGEEQMTGPVR